MLAVIIMAIILSVAAFFGIRMVANGWVEDNYNSEAAKKARYDEYISNLQTYVSKNDISSEDTLEITHWMSLNPNVYLFIYKDGQLFFDGSGDSAADKGGDSGNSGSAEGNNGTVGGAGADESTDHDNELGDKEPVENDRNETSGAEGDSSVSAGKDTGSSGADSDKPESDSSSGGLTPAQREEIIALAQKNGLTPIDFSDGTLFVSLVDFTDTVYADVIDIISIIAAMLTLVLLLMLYFRVITTKISRLATDVSAVYEVDSSQSIRTYIGNDELSELTRNVEQMRMSMLDSLKKEKEAIEANTELITSMSHDVRTPLTVLLGYLDIMKTHTQDETMHDYIKAAELTAMRMKELSDDMFRYFLVFAGGNIDVDMVEYDARTLFDQMFAEHMILMREKGYEVELSYSNGFDENITVSTDAPKLMRVIDNLVSNIYKYADKDGMITLNVTRIGTSLEIEITNKVIKDKSGAESNGIGLKTCRKLCEALGILFRCGSEVCGADEIFTTCLGFTIIAHGAEGARKNDTEA